jgi:hypothetical protein
MTSPDTRPPAITQAQIDAIIAALQRPGGANVNVSDPRVSQVQTWILGVVGIGLIGAGTWVGQSISELSIAVATLQAQQAIVADHEQRLRVLERQP